jgi:intracellular multiplication protein IcmQ
MRSNKLSDEKIKVVLAAFKEALDEGPWAHSALLRVLGKKLQSIHDLLADEVNLEKEARMEAASQHHSQQKPKETEQEVFVALYTSNGVNLQSWEQVLANLPRQMVSRPVYADEEAIKSAIRSRENPVNEAYVAVYINKADILHTPEDRTPKERQGTPLLTLKDKSFSLSQVVRFVHGSGVYTLKRGRLIKD